jgi:hypothetical protein
MDTWDTFNKKMNMLGMGCARWDASMRLAAMARQ